MKINNKGFAISTMLYVILILALIIVACALAILNNRSNIINLLKNTSIEKVSEENNNNNYICHLVSGNGNYTIGDKYSCDVSNTETYEFYLLNNNENSIDLVMEEAIKFNKGRYSDSVVINNDSKSPYGNDNNPDIALFILKRITDNWFYLDDRMDIINEDEYSIDYTGYKARLISYNDIKNYLNNSELSIDFISNTLTSTIYNNNLIYSVKNNIVNIDGKNTDEYDIVPIITVNKETIKN